MGKDNVLRLLELFNGNQFIYGLYYNIPEKGNERGKKKGTACSKRGEVTRELWEEIHLNPKRQEFLGIAPIRDDGTVLFGAIDIDVYKDRDLHKDLLAKIYKFKLPLVVCTTKSGGAHCYCFLSTPISAETMRNKLLEFASVMGYSKNSAGTDVEIFPKETKVLQEKGDIPSWINMPYPNGENTVRYALDNSQNPLSLEEFLDYAEKTRVTAEELEAIRPIKSDALYEGPPCLNNLCQTKFPEGSRNLALYNLCVYAKKAFPDTWEQKVEEYNHEYLDPPCTSTEVMGVIKSVRKKSYKYKCQDAPINSFCNPKLCRLKKFGVNENSNLPVFGALTKIETSPPIWFLTVEVNDTSHRLELTTDDLQNPRKFQKRCMETANIMPTLPKQDVWETLIDEALKNVISVEMPEDASPQGMMMEYLERFCTTKAQAKTREEILLRRPYTEDGYTYFRMADFLEYLKRQKFNDATPQRIAAWLRNIEDAGHKQFNIKGKCVQCWKIREFVQLEDDKMPVPEDLNEGVNY